MEGSIDLGFLFLLSFFYPYVLFSFVIFYFGPLPPPHSQGVDHICIVLLMQNFNINMPSIPSDRIQFKIQNNKLKGFNNKEPRFKDSLSYLTSHFVNSFPNLSTPMPPKEPDTTSQLSTNLSSCFCEKVDNFRTMVGDNKKNLLVKYEEEDRHRFVEIPEENKYDKGYSFSKHGFTDVLDSQLPKMGKGKDRKGRNMDIHMDSYCLKTEESEDESENEEKVKLEKRREERMAKKKVIKTSAVFDNQDRWKSLERDLKDKIKLGPGSYLLNHQSSVQEPRNAKLGSKSMIDSSKPMKLEQIVELIKNIDNPEINPFEKKSKKQDAVKDTLMPRQSSMFVKGNYDRFGSPKYPINPPLKVPGPGAYHCENSLQTKANQILILQEQRKLLREWYNR